MEVDAAGAARGGGMDVGMGVEQGEGVVEDEEPYKSHEDGWRFNEPKTFWHVGPFYNAELDENNLRDANDISHMGVVRYPSEHDFRVREKRDQLA